MKKACSICLTNCIRLHGLEDENNEEDLTACQCCTFRESNGNAYVEGDRNPSFLRKMTDITMSSLKLPLSFVIDQKERLGNFVILEGPSKEKWKVALHGSSPNSNLKFGQGWEKFVADHFLQLDDQLFFSLLANSFFQVEVYDGSGCQKKSALDATNTPLSIKIKDLQSHNVSPMLTLERHGKYGNVTQPNEQLNFIEFKTDGPEFDIRGGHDIGVDVNDANTIENVAKAAMNDIGVAENGLEVVQSGTKMIGDAIEVVNEMDIPKTRKEHVEIAGSKDSKVPDFKDMVINTAKVVNGGLLPKHNVSGGKVFPCRRHVTKFEVERALQAAHALKLSNPNFLLVMRDTHVYKSFWLGVPRQFRDQWMPRKNRAISLVNKGGHWWSVNWMPQGGISGGWRRFAIDHCLDDQDVCVFELIDQDHFVLLVHIFRVLGCVGEDPGLYIPATMPSKSLERKKNKRKSFQVSSNDHASKAIPTPLAKMKGLKKSTSLEKLVGIGKSHIIQAFVEESARPQALLGNSQGITTNLGVVEDFVSLEVSCAANSTSTAVQRPSVVYRLDSQDQCASIPNPSRSKRSRMRRTAKVVHIYSGRTLDNGTEFLTELEGYPEGEINAILDRDDDTGFWWVPSKLFEWDMLHCFIE